MRKWPWQKFASTTELDTDIEACFGKEFLISLKENGFICQRLVTCVVGGKIDWQCVASNLRRIGEYYNTTENYWHIFNLSLKHGPQFQSTD